MQPLKMRLQTWSGTIKIRGPHINIRVRRTNTRTTSEKTAMPRPSVHRSSRVDQEVKPARFTVRLLPLLARQEAHIAIESQADHHSLEKRVIETSAKTIPYDQARGPTVYGTHLRRKRT